MTNCANQLSVNLNEPLLFKPAQNTPLYINTVSKQLKENNFDTTIQNNDKNMVSFQPPIFRYKFTDDFMKELFCFSKIHQYDDRHSFKDAWKIWIEENDILIKEECTHLVNNGYNGDILDKMFKSARYYFRKKSTVKKDPTKRREYISISKNLLDTIDNHIKINILANTHFKPSEGFKQFCQENMELLKDEIKTLTDCGLKNASDIENKIKKTYQNRYFLVINK